MKLAKRFTTILIAIVHEIKVERITFMAGSIAYNAFVSLMPFLFLMLAIISALGDRQLEEGFVTLTESVVTPGAGEILVSELQSVPVSASIIGIALLIWGMLRIFRSIDMAFSNIYETQTENTLLNQLVDGTFVFVSISAVVISVIVVQSTFDIDPSAGGFWFVERLVLVLVVAVALLPMYYLFPDEPDLQFVEILPGVVFASAGLVAFESLFRLYVVYGSPAVDNSVLAGILVFLTWLYFNGLILLLGVVINAVLSNRSEDVSIEPVFGGISPAEQAVGGNPSQVRARAGDSGTNPHDLTQQPVPEAELEELQQTLAQAGTVKIQVDDGEPITMPAPDLTTVDAHTSPIPFVNDTAGFEMQWCRRTNEGTYEGQS